MFSLILFLCLKQEVCAQALGDSMVINFESITVDDGLSQGMVRHILQTHDGLMWFATKDGLNKYDGYNIVVYRNIPGDSLSLPDNYVLRLAEDAYGHIILSTATHGLYLFDPKTEHFYPIRLQLGTKTIRPNAIYLNIQKEGIFIASSEAIYFAEAKALHQLDPASGKLKLDVNIFFSYPDSLRYDSQRNYFETRPVWTKSGAIWIGFYDRALMFAPKDFSSHRPTMEVLWPKNTAIKPLQHYSLVNPVGGSDDIFIYTDTWMGIYNSSNMRFEWVKAIQNDGSSMNSLIALPDGRFLINRGKQPIMVDVHTKSISNLKMSADFHHLINSSNCIDANQNVWLGTSGYGVLKIDGGYRYFQSFTGNGWHLLRNQSHEGLFVKDAKLFRYNREGKHFEPLLPDAFYQKHNFEMSYAEVFDKPNYWLKGRNAKQQDKRLLYCYNTETGYYKTYHMLDLYPRMFESMFKDKRNQIWINFLGADKHNKLRLLNEAKDSISTEFSFPVANTFQEYSFVSDYYIDSDNSFWLGTTAGLFHFDPSKARWKQFTNNPKDTTSLSGDLIFSLCPDPIQPERYLWIGTGGYGLNRFDKQTGICLRFNEFNRLPNLVIYGLLSDNTHLWLSTNHGLCCLDVRTFAVRNFTEKDGLVGNEFNRYEYQQLEDGSLLFGGVKGYTIVNPSMVLRDTIHTQTLLTGLMVFNKKIGWKENADILDAPIQFAKSITLPYQLNMFSIEFASTEYHDASKRNYTCFLKGFHQSWISNGTQHSVTFTNLDPGTYTLYVAACDENGRIISNQASIQIHILTPWWKSWWFRGLILLFVVVLLYGFYRYRLQQATAMLNLRNRIASDLHDEIGSTLSSISLSSALLMRRKFGQDPEVMALLKRISRNAGEMLEAMGDIVWTINAQNDSFEQVFNRMRAFAVEVFEPINIQFEFTADERLNKLKVDIMQRKNLYLLYKEAIHNIAKYAHAHTVTITIQRTDDGRMYMQIRDDGRGFDMKALNNRTLGGNGLMNMQNRAAALKGSITIDSVFGQGTCITLYAAM